MFYTEQYPAPTQVPLPISQFSWQILETWTFNISLRCILLLHCKHLWHSDHILAWVMLLSTCEEQFYADTCKMSIASGWIILHLKLHFYSLPAILLEDRNSSESAWKNKISISALNTPEPAMMHEPLVGSQKRKARKTKITHLVRTADGRVSPAAGTLGKEIGVKMSLKLNGWRKFKGTSNLSGGQCFLISLFSYLLRMVII